MSNLTTYLTQARNRAMHFANTLKLNTSVESNRLIGSWLGILPVLESYGMEVTSFSLGYSLSPYLEVELKGSVASFPQERLKEILEEEKATGVRTVFQALKSTLVLYERFDSTPVDDLVIKIKVALSPEVRVFIGAPLIA
jgi:hypothetical protein